MSWRIPNAVMVSEDDKYTLRQLFDVVKATSAFRAVAEGDWTVNRAEIVDADEVVQYYRCPETEREEWYRQLTSTLDRLGRVAIIEIQNRSRVGLEALPAHVAGRVATFFVTVEDRKVAFVLKSIYSV